MRSVATLLFAVSSPLFLVGCSEYGIGDDPNSPAVTDDLDGDGIPDNLDDDFMDPWGGSPLRDTDEDGTIDSEDSDADGDGIDNQFDLDPDGDGAPGWTLPENPADDPPIDETGLPQLREGDARGRVCAPNGTTWVAGAVVMIETDRGTYETTTNGDGWWQLPGLPAGIHEVEVIKGSFSMRFTIEVLEGEITDAVFDECLEQGDLQIAVVTGQYDSIGTVLDHLAITYDNVQGGEASVHSFLTNPAALAQYDMVFFNCGMNLNWAIDERDVVGTNLAEFVDNGGSIYASDWAYYTVEAAFPDKINFVGEDEVPGAAFRGVSGYVNNVSVNDPSMVALLGSNSASINYDLGGWVPMESTASDVNHLLEGDFQVYNNFDIPVGQSGPLSAKFQHGNGNVTFTSFHNEVQTTLDMDILLQEVVLSL